MDAGGSALVDAGGSALVGAGGSDSAADAGEAGAAGSVTSAASVMSAVDAVDAVLSSLLPHAPANRARIAKTDSASNLPRNFAPPARSLRPRAAASAVEL